MRFLITFSYDGSNYIGFQKQKNNHQSIQNKIEYALHNMLNKDVRIFGSGRTDKGVHAHAQTAHFDLETPPQITNKEFIRLINLRLPEDIRIIKLKKVRNDFHARMDAKSKIYTYYISKRPLNSFNSRFLVHIDSLDIKKIKNAIDLLIGCHDFEKFSKHVPGKNTIKTIYSINIKETKHAYTFSFHGSSFLQYMIRKLMGTFILLSQDKMTLDDIKSLLNKNSTCSPPTAASKGLFLTKVFYK